MGGGEFMQGDRDGLTFRDLEPLVDGATVVCRPDMNAARLADEYLQEKVAGGEVIYGVNTGFGSLQSTRIGTADLDSLQVNLIRSHACGTGKPVDDRVVRLMLLLKIHSLAQGHSGVRPATIDRLVRHLEHNVVPVVYDRGSLGASGDLAPLAHMSLPLIGEGEVTFRAQVVSARSALDALGWEPLHLGPKEGLALLNGTQFMAAHGVLGVIHGQRLAALADLVGAISLEAFGGRSDAFDELVHRVRPHPGQLESAARLRSHLDGSEMIALPKDRLQDPYSFRCMPQVHGASLDVVRQARDVIEREINSVSDNPLIFVDEDRIISGGNFHGQPLAFAMDFLAIALSEFASISERRTYQLLSGAGPLPTYLVEEPGLNSGFMVPQYVAASLVSQNKQLSTPASVDSIVSSNGQEDHVSMGANAGTKLMTVIDNVYEVLAIELFTAAQGMEFRRPSRSSRTIERVLRDYRGVVPFLRSDDVMYPHMSATVRFIRRLRFSAEHDDVRLTPAESGSSR